MRRLYLTALATLTCARRAHSSGSLGGSVLGRARVSSSSIFATAVGARPPSAAAVPAPAAHAAFDLVADEHVAEFGIGVRTYVHKLTGATVLSVVSPNDEHKTFLAAFKTAAGGDALGSTGVAHILEHSVLCGSAKYPLKEPFVELLKGSCQTFLNALTYPDRTVYPVSSLSTADMYNLMDVYLDATLCPLATRGDERGRRIFRQEGWRVHVDSSARGGESADKGGGSEGSAPPGAAPAESGLSLQGVVYNEMKGVYQSADSLHARTVQQALFPDTAYSHDSGGAPDSIPALSYEHFCEFHAHCYDPARALLYAYGDDPEAERLRRIDERLAAAHAERSARAAADSGAPAAAGGAAAAVAAAAGSPGWQRLRPQPWRVRSTYPAARGGSDEPAAAGGGGGDTDTTYVSVNWLLAESPLSPVERLRLGVLSNLLLGTSAAPLRRALLKSGLGTAVIGGGLSDGLLQPTFSVGLKGVAPARGDGPTGGGPVDAVQSLVLKTLEQIAAPPGGSAGADAGAGGSAGAPGGADAEIAAEAARCFDADALEGALNSLEFRLRELCASERRGLSLGLAAAADWTHGRATPIEGWRFAEPLAQVRAELQGEGGAEALRGLVRTLLLANTHRVTVSLEPSAEHGPQVASAEATHLRRAARLQEAPDAGAQAARRAELERDTAELLAAQRAPDPPEALQALPTLRLADLERRVAPPVPTDVAAAPKATLASGGGGGAGAPSPAGRLLTITHAMPECGGIVYADVALGLESVLADLAEAAASGPWPPPAGTAAEAAARRAAADLELFPLLLRALTEAGAGARGEVAYSRELTRCTGGVSASLLHTTVARGPGAVPPALGAHGHIGLLVMRGRALASRSSELSGLMRDALVAPALGNRDKLRQIAREQLARAEAAARSSGNALAASRAAAAFSLDGWIGEQTGGITRLDAARRLAKAIDDDGAWAELHARLRSLHARLLCADEAVLNLGADEQSMPAALDAFASLTAELRAAAADSELAARATDAAADAARERAASALGAPFVAPPLREGLRAPLTVGHACLAAQLPPIAGAACADRLPGSVAVASRLMRTGHLWDAVRVQGGAYGAAVAMDRAERFVTFTSYRDPTPGRSVGAFREAGAALVRMADELPDGELERVLVGAAGQLERPMGASAKSWAAMIRHVTGYADEARQLWRDEVFGTDRAQLRAIGHAVEAATAEAGAPGTHKPPSIVLVGGQPILDAAQAAGLDGGLAVRDML